MKKLFLYVTLILSFTSCEKYLEVKPSNILALKTYDDVKSLLGSHLKLYTVSAPMNWQERTFPGERTICICFSVFIVTI